MDARFQIYQRVVSKVIVRNYGNSYLISLTIGCTQCQSDIEVYNDSDEEYTHAPGIYGIYKVQNYLVNDRVYFKKGAYGIFWDGNDDWYIGYHIVKQCTKHP